MKADEMWRSVAEGKADVTLAAWLPVLHDHYWKEFKGKVENLGPNVQGTKSGLVVPDVTLGRQTAASGLRNEPYITVDSIPELKEYAGKFHYVIEGIDPEAGVMKKAKEAIEAYDLDEFDLVKGNEQTMTRALAEAIKQQQWIVITGWVPHWMFARWELKFLEDPKKVFGDQPGHIDTVVRRGLKEDLPEVYDFLDRFQWSAEQLGQLMIWINDNGGVYPYEKALRYLRTHPDQVQSWLP
jgi:glycine betaine/proline transport system substrate-binding protein